MKIQYISFKKRNYSSITNSTISNPMAFDSFDINIIDLTDYQLWHNLSEQLRITPYHKDFDNLKSIIASSRCQNIVFLFPQDFIISFDYGYISSQKGYGYRRSENMKNVLNSYFSVSIKELGIDYYGSFGFENNIYQINDLEFTSSFFFLNFPDATPLQIAKDSKKWVTIRFKRFICSFLHIDNETDLFSFLEDLKLIKDDDTPQWLRNYVFLNDAEINNSIEKQNKIILDANKEILALQSKLEQNLYFKKILSTNDKELVERVYKILDAFFETNLSNAFIDLKQEDFLIELDDVIFIGEIKGVNSNVKNEHINQIDNHLDEYEENHDVSKTIKKILIINHQRKEPLLSRVAVNEKQINKAVRDDTLIIETTTLLTLFEKFMLKTISSNQIKNIFKNEIGLLQLKE